jgi:hypothetical protein
MNKKENLNVIEKKITDASGVEQVVYEAEFEGKGRISLFASAFKNLEPSLSVDQALKLFQGETVDSVFSYKNGDGKLGMASPCSIVPLRIEERNKQVGDASFENRVLKVGIAWHLLKKEGQSVYGYKIFNKRANGGKGAPVQFFKTALVDDDESVELSPKACFELIEKGSAEIAGKQISYCGEIKEDKLGEPLKLQKARLRNNSLGGV